MKVAKKRAYLSPIRQKQADETRERIIAAARKLLEEHGYAGMTMEAVARNGGVAVPTVYAIFGSKTGILSAILDAVRFGSRFQDIVREAMQTLEPRERVKYAARIARRIYESESSIMDLLRGAGAVAPSLAQTESERDCQRYEAQKAMIQYLIDTRSLRRGLTEQKARDILWSLTSRDLYRMMVRDRGWTAQDYENWLAETITEALLGKQDL